MGSFPHLDASAHATGIHSGGGGGGDICLSIVTEAVSRIANAHAAARQHAAGPPSESATRRTDATVGKIPLQCAAAKNSAEGDRQRCDRRQPGRMRNCFDIQLKRCGKKSHRFQQRRSRPLSCWTQTDGRTDEQTFRSKYSRGWSRRRFRPIGGGGGIVICL